MGKIKRVVIEYDDKTYIAEGKDAESWLAHVSSIERLAYIHGVGGWDKWTEVKENKQ